jgi:SAM-dependent methyltransferase
METTAPTRNARRAFGWPAGFERIPDEDWTREPVDDFGLSYDAVGAHGWYQNLEPLVAQVLSALDDHEVFIDYSGGTGLLGKRVLANVNYPVGLVEVDASPKFLRVALEHLGQDERVAFRLLEYLRDEKRLRMLDEVLGSATRELDASVLAAANAIHLYPNLTETLASWARVLRPGGLVVVCSANLKDPRCRPGDWIIDETVAKVNEIAATLVAREPSFEEYRETLEDSERMNAHSKLRDKVFVPVRPLEEYLDAFDDAGFSVLHVFTSTIEARVDEWGAFLKTYHDGVLSWVGGSPKVEGQGPSETALKHRQFLIDYSLEKLFAGQSSFPCNWTYITCRRR